MAIILKGCSPALVTPFLPSGEVDFESYAALVGRQVRSGASFLTALATTGETPALSLKEKLRLFEITRENAGGLPILVGVGSNSVPATLDNIAAFPDADAYLVVVPFYNKPTQEGMYLYFKEICAHTQKPVVIYNVPGRTGANMSAETTLRLAREVSGIAGIKEASGNFDQVKAIIDGAPRGFSVLSGDDDMTLGIMEAGGQGVISVAANALPKEVCAMVDAWIAGDEVLARHLDKLLQPLFKGCFIESNPIPVKEALSQLGLCTNLVRLPLTPATAQTAAAIKEILSEWK